MEDKIIEVLFNYISKSPVWLFILVIIYMIGLAMSMIMKEMKVLKGNKWSKIIVFVQGAAFTAIIFCVMNMKNIINSSITLEIVEERLLSATLISLAITGIVLVVVYIKKCREIKWGQEKKERKINE